MIEPTTAELEAKRRDDARVATENTPIAEPGKFAGAPLDNEVRAEQGELSRDTQEFDTARVEREKHAEGGSNRPSIGGEPRESVAGRLRAFEDAEFGEKAVRINGAIEKGSGSPYAAMIPEKKLQYIALEKLVLAEQKLTDAEAIVSQAAADRDEAAAHVEECEQAVRTDADSRE